MYFAPLLIKVSAARKQAVEREVNRKKEGKKKKKKKKNNVHRKQKRNTFLASNKQRSFMLNITMINIRSHFK